MHFDLVGFIFNSLVLLFFTMTLGNLFGDIKFKKFNFGITGTLFIDKCKLSSNFIDNPK